MQKEKNPLSREKEKKTKKTFHPPTIIIFTPLQYTTPTHPYFPPALSACVNVRVRVRVCAWLPLRCGMDHVSLPADGPVSASDVVDYARRISYTTFAPVGYVPGAPLHGVMPPAPQARA